MNKNYLLENKWAQKLYASVEDLPIIDYHCHLSPKEIFEDKPFDNIGDLWLGGDHYKWRLMRTAGVDEAYITGDAPMHDKFLKFAEVLGFAAGHPLYHWCHMELSMYFGIHTPINGDTAEAIWLRANETIAKRQLSPRKLITGSGVEMLCTTDDIADTLEWHEKIAADESFPVRVLPSYRTDNLLLMRREGYGAYLQRLQEVSGVEIRDLAGLKAAAENRLDFFTEKGCRVCDLGVPFFPDRIYADADAAAVFADVLCGKEISDQDYMGLLGNLYCFFGKLYADRNLVMQWHLSVVRNANSQLFAAVGADCGADCVGDGVPAKDLVKLLDGVLQTGKMPETVLYTLNGANAAQMASVAGSFPHVRMGAAWWFCDHKRGIEEQIDNIAENACLGAFLGMLTDSRSFLSYARHDYFRRILCSKIGRWVELGEYDGAAAATLARKICYDNIKNLIGGNE